MRTVAVVLAGGVGERLGPGLPKQLREVAGRPIVEHTVAAVSACPEIDDVMLLMAAGWVDAVRAVLGSRYPKLTRILAGGPTRNASTRIALDALGGQDCKVLIHDAVRPLLDPRIVTACVRALDGHDAVDVVVPCTDTIVVVQDGVIGELPRRDRLHRVQTPQGFRLGTLRRAYELAGRDPDFASTDDVGVVLRYLPEVPVAVVPGAEHNIKITHPIDLVVADTLLRIASPPPPGLSEPEYRSGLTGRTVVVFGEGTAGLARAGRQYGAQVVEHPGGAALEDVVATLAGAGEQTGRVDHVVVTAGALQVAAAAQPYLSRSGGSLLLLRPTSAPGGSAGPLARALARDWARDRVRVNAVNAGGGWSTDQVARCCLEVLLSGRTGQVVDLDRLADATSAEPFRAAVDRLAGPGPAGD